jgi:HEAT repeat protein
MAMLWLMFTGSILAEEAKPQAPQPTGRMAEILARIPNDSAAEATKALDDLLKLGPKGIQDLGALLVEPGKGDDSRARLAFHGLALYVARPGAETERMMVCEAIRGLLAGSAPPAVKGFFLRQLRLMACPKAVPAISEFLLNEELSEYAAQALVSIGGDEASGAFLKALPKASGKCRLTIVQNLGVMRDSKAAPELMKAAGDADREVRLAALYALGNIGDAAAADIIAKAARAESLYERSRATDALLLLAGRLGEAGKKAEAEKIYRDLLKSNTDAKDRHVRCAAIAGLARLLGPAAMGDLAAAIKGDDPQVRAAAIQAAMAMPGDDVTAKWVRELPALPPEAKGAILAMLARRGGPAAAGAIMEAMADKDEGVRLAAITAAGWLADEKAVALLLSILNSGSDREKQAARASLERAPGEKASAAAAAATAAAASPAFKKDLLGILGARGARQGVDAALAAAKDADLGVRMAAIGVLETLADEKQAPALVGLVAGAMEAGERQAAEKALGAVCSRAANKDAAADAVMKAEAGAPPDARAALVRVLGRIGGATALAGVRAAVKDADEKIQESAVRALADWPDAAAAPDLLEIAKGGAKQTLRVLALRGYVRLSGVPQGRPAAERLKMLQDAMAAAHRPDERRMVLGALADVKDAAALKMAAGLLSDEALKEEAAAATVKIVKALGGQPKDEIKAALQKVLGVSKNEGTLKDARQALQKVK